MQVIERAQKTVVGEFHWASDTTTSCRTTNEFHLRL